MKSADSNAELKKAVAIEAAKLVRKGQSVGLGTGSTAALMIQELGRRNREEGLDLRCLATSFQSAKLAAEHGLIVLRPESLDHLDISIDGADEIDPSLNLIKGGGAAHTLEKIIHAMARSFIVIADSSKKVGTLGSKFAVPIEVIPASVTFILRRVREKGAESAEIRMGLRKDGPVVTDNGNLVIDARFSIGDPVELEKALNCIPGIVENGIFSAASVKPQLALIAGDGGVERLGSYGG